jgi:hypothetical protein
LYTARLPEELTSKSELKDLTKLSERYSLKPLKEFVKLFDPQQFEDEDDENDVSTSIGGFVDEPNSCKVFCC